MTFHELCSAYLIARKPCKTINGMERLAAQFFYRWPNEMPSRVSVLRWHQSLAHTPAHANKALRWLRAMLNFAIAHELYDGPNFTAGIKLHPTFSRERVLNEEEVGVVLAKAQAAPAALRVMLTVLLRTGCRLSEARTMQWAHVNLRTGAWHQPITKNGKPHTTYLSTQARAAITSLPKIGAYVFVGHAQPCLSAAAVEKAWGLVRTTWHMTDVRLHDFRRTVATHLYRQTRDEYLVKKCLNHHHAGVTAIYVRTTQDDVAVALQHLSNHFDTLQEASHANVSDGSSRSECAVGGAELGATMDHRVRWEQSDPLSVGGPT